MAPGRAPRLPAGSILAALLLTLSTAAASSVAAGAPTAASQDVELWPNQPLYGPGEPIGLTIGNNGSTPVQGTPRITVHHCPIGSDVCSPYEVTVHRWEGSSTTLAPGERLTHTWDRTTDDGEEAPEGTYEAHLTWERNTTGDEVTDASPRFTLDNATDGSRTHDADAPRIDVRHPSPGSRADALEVTVDVGVEGTDEIDRVDVRVDDRVVARGRSIGELAFNATTTVELMPGSHLLEVTVRDDAGRVNTSRTAFTVAPATAMTAGSLVFETTASGNLDDVEVDGSLLFDAVRSTGDGAGFRASMTDRALVLTAPEADRIVHTLADGWTGQAIGGGVLLTHEQLDASLIIVPRSGSTLELQDGAVSASLGPGGELVLRPVTAAPGDDRIAQSVLTGDVGAEIDARGLETVDVLPYEGINASVAAREGRIAAIIDARQPHGRTVVVDVPDAMRHGALSIELDGEALERASSLEDALDPSDDAGRSEAYVVEDDGQRRVVVSVASFSARELVIEAAEDVGAFLTPAAVAGAAALVAAAGWALFRRPDA